jgi:Lrp/AsnC family transcriptional regulator, leucine-responsive regulatory protein
MKLDVFDRNILQIYQLNTSDSAEQIGAQVGLSAAAVQRRLKRLREDRIILAETADLDYARLGLGVTIIVQVDLVDESATATLGFRKKLDNRSEVQQCYGVAGNVDYVLILIVPDLLAYDIFCQECLLHDANVRSFTTQVVLDAHKRRGAVNIPL